MGKHDARAALDMFEANVETGIVALKNKRIYSGLEGGSYEFWYKHGKKWTFCHLSE